MMVCACGLVVAKDQAEFITMKRPAIPGARLVFGEL